MTLEDSTWEEVAGDSLCVFSTWAHHHFPSILQELEALSKARYFISSGAVAGSAEKHLPTLLQRKSSVAFLRSWGPQPAELDQVETSLVVVVVVSYNTSKLTGLRFLLLSYTQS